MTSPDAGASIAELRAANERLIITALREQAARAEAEAAAAARAAALDLLPDGMVMVDPAGSITFANAAARRLDAALQPGRSLVGAAKPRLMPARGGERPHPAAEPVAQALRGEAVAAVETRQRQADGTERTVQRSAAPLRSGDGRLLGAVLLLRDLGAAPALAEVEAAPDFVAGDLAVQYRTKQVTLNGQPVKLTPKEYELLYRLVANAGRVLPTQTLLDRIWGAKAEADAHVQYVKIYVRRLRQKIEAEGGRLYIETVRGLGYRFVP